MDTATFYAVVSGTCFTLVGLWWGVVREKKEWLQSADMRELAAGVYLSFLIPGLMGMGAQIGIEQPFLWQAIFTVAAASGLFSTTRIWLKTAKIPSAGIFHKNRWGIPAIYIFIMVFALFPGLAGIIGLKGIQVEAIFVTGLLLIGHGLAWELLTSNQPTTH